MQNTTLRIASVLTGASYLFFWWLFIALLPIARLPDGYSSLILSEPWVLVNSFQVVAILSFLVFFVRVDQMLYQGPIDRIMEILQIVGLFVFGSVAFYETFLWPVFAKTAPESLDLVHGAVFANGPLRGVLIVGGLCLMVSNIHLGLKIRRLFGIWGTVYAVGFGLFCLGFMIPPIRYILQSVGLSLFGVGFLAFGVAKAANSPAGTQRVRVERTSRVAGS